MKAIRTDQSTESRAFGTSGIWAAEQARMQKQPGCGNWGRSAKNIIEVLLSSKAGLYPIVAATPG
jgi:hypothetical protein